MPGSEPPVAGQPPAMVQPQPNRPQVDARPAGASLRRTIVQWLRRMGPASPDQLANALEVGRGGIVSQLRALESAGLVARRTVRHGVGRPRHLYDVTPDAQDLFPANYDGLATGLLGAIEAIGGDALIDEVLAARRRQIGGRLRERFADRLPANAALEDRVGELSRFQDELGYLCEAGVDADGALRLREHNCAIYRVAAVRPEACRAELSLFRDVLGVDVVRETHILSGDRSCTYRVLPVAARS